MIRGLLHYALGDLDSGLSDLDKLLNESTFNLIGVETGKLTVAISEFKRAIENDKDNHSPETLLSLDKCLLLTG